MVHVTARITFKAESVDTGLGLLKTLVEETRKEPGCIDYQLFQRADAPHVFQTAEQWLDRVAVDAHMKSPHIVAAITAGGPMFAAPPEILSFHKLM